MKEYTAETSNATNAITVTPADATAVVEIEVNGIAHQNGAAATWQAGENIVVVAVTNGDVSVAYTITVTKI